jgi:tetratricopeptide (TPR) repeat protein
MCINRIRANNDLAIAKCVSNDCLTMAEASGGTAHFLRREGGIACRILIALLLCSSITFAQIKSRQLSDFSEGLVAVNEPTGAPKGKESWFKYWGKCGYRNEKGEWVIPAQFDWAGPFNSEGYALVIVGSRVHDEEVFLKWKKVFGGLAKQRAGGRVLLFDGGRLAVIDKTGRVLIELPRLAGKLGVRFQWIDDDGRRSTSNALRYMDSKWEDTGGGPDLNFYEGRAVVQLPQGCNYIQKSGDSLAYVFAQPFSGCHSYSQGWAAVADNSKKWGFIGMDGQWQVPATYEAVSGFSEGFCAVKVGDRWGYIDKTGAMVIQPKYENGFIFSKGLATVKVGTLWGAIDKTGAMVIPAKYEAPLTFSEGLAYVRDGKVEQFIDNRGQTAFIVNSPFFLSLFSSFHEGLVLVRTWEYGTNHYDESAYMDRTGKIIFSIKGDCQDFSKGVAECKDTYNPENSIRFDKMGRIISRHGDSVSMEKSLAASPGPAKEDKPAVASSTPVIQDKAEYTAYMSALKSPDLLQRAGALEAFVRQYPNSIVKFGALEGAMFAYAQANSQAKAAEFAQIILKSDPNHVRALAIMTFVKRFSSAQNDSKAAAEVGSYAERGLKALAGWAKPNGMSDDEYAAARKQAEALLCGGAAYDALFRKNYEAARNYYLKALAIESSNLLDTYQLSIAELEMIPIDINGFWHIGRAIQLARAQNQPAAEQTFANYGKARYRIYHGSDEGWDAMVAQAKGQAPPPGFTVQRGSASTLQVDPSAEEDDSFWGDIDDQFEKIGDATPQDKKSIDGKLPSNSKQAQGSAELSAALAKAFYEKGDFDAAIRESDAALKSDPNMASAYYFRGASYQQKADYYTALVDYNRALHFDPKYTNALGGRADVYYFTRQYRLGIEDYTAFIAAMPKSSVAYSRRATCHYGLGEYRQTVTDYEKAIALDPNLLEAVNGLAWTLATAPADGIRNGLMAVGYGERALSLAGQSDKFLHLDTLAAAYAEAGRFTDAVATQAKAISLIPKDYDAKEAAQFKVRLQAYKDSKPWREQPQR